MGKKIEKKEPPVQIGRHEKKKMSTSFVGKGKKDWFRRAGGKMGTDTGKTT